MRDLTQPIYDQNWLDETDKLTDNKEKMKRKTTKFATLDGEFHRVDTQGNYFINGKCQNPKADLKGIEIGYNTPDLSWKEFETNIAENIWLSQEKS